MTRTHRDRLFTPRQRTRLPVATVLLISALGITAGSAARAQTFTEFSNTLSNGAYLDLFDSSRLSTDGTTTAGTEYTLDPTGSYTTSVEAVTVPTGSNTPYELAPVAGDTYSYGYGASANASVVVGASVGAVSQAAVWSGGAVTGLGTLSGYTDSIAYGASNDGSVVTGLAINSSTNSTQVFRWTGGGGMTDLGALPGGYTDSSIGMSYGNTISGNGSAITGDLSSSTGALATQAFLWTSVSGVTALGTQSGGTFSIASAISKDGSIVIGYGDDSDGNEQAFKWTSASGMAGLGLAYGNFQTNANSASGTGGLVVGNYFHQTAGTTDYQSGYVFSSSYGYADIADYLQNSLGETSALAGWTDIDAYSISADGTTIIGDGTDASGNYAYWEANDPGKFTAPYMESAILAANLAPYGDASAPEPGSLILLLTGVSAAFAWSKRKIRGKSVRQIGV